MSFVSLTANSLKGGHHCFLGWDAEAQEGTVPGPGPHPCKCQNLTCMRVSPTQGLIPTAQQVSSGSRPCWVQNEDQARAGHWERDWVLLGPGKHHTGVQRVHLGQVVTLGLGVLDHKQKSVSLQSPEGGLRDVTREDLSSS